MADTIFEKWKSKLEIMLIQPNSRFDDLYNVLIQMRNEGLTNNVTLDLLTQIRNLNLSEQQEDLLLELMDVATGYCSPHLRLW